MERIHFLNLTNGLLCAGHVPDIDSARFMRLQSTWCEQKRWDDVLLTLPPDFYMALATGRPITCHDVSEKPRRTRAMWQGLAVARRICGWAWTNDPSNKLPRISNVRGGKSFEQYVDAYYHLCMSDRAMRYVKYFRKYLNDPTFKVDVCDGEQLWHA